MIDMAKLYRASDNRMDAHSQLKRLLWGLAWEHPWVCLLISLFISSRSTAVTVAARTRLKKKGGIEEHDVVTDSRGENGK